MTDENKQQAEFKITKGKLVITAIISLIFLVVYFTLTVPPISLLEDLNKTSLYIEDINKSYEWQNLFWLITMIVLLSMLYLLYYKLINSSNPFINQIMQYKQTINFIIIMGTVIVLRMITIEMKDNCCNWWVILSARLSYPQEPLNLRNVLIGIAGVITLIFAWQRLVITDQQKDAQVKQTESHIRQTDIESERRLNERFDNAANVISQELNKSSLPIHLGAISSLSALARNSPENTQRCLDIICSCNQWMEEYFARFIEEKKAGLYSSRLLKEDNRIAKEDNQGKENQISLSHEMRSQEALVAVNHILADISVKRFEQLKELKFHNKMLCGISLNNLKLDGIDFRNTYFVAAVLNRISLKEAKLYGSHLEGAYLWDANLQGASLNNAHLEGASLNRAHLEGASLNNEHFEGASLNHTHLMGADLEGTNLNGSSLINSYLESASLNLAHMDDANLEGANLEGADLVSASLEGANLKGANLYDTNLEDAYLDGANLYGAHLDGCSFGWCSFR